MEGKRLCIHLVGIGGVGMSGIAKVLLSMGYKVTGSDIRWSLTIESLAKEGICISVGHREENVEGADILVFSSAVNEENVEIKRARKMRIPVIKRSQMLAELMRLKYAIAISGSHGKTTTTSMIALLLAEAGLSPTAVIGGKFKNIKSNAVLGDGKYMVAEADESDGTFIKLSPMIAVVTNIDKEHMDYYPDINSLKDAFTEFLNSVPFYGCAILCADDEGACSIIERVEKKLLLYGTRHEAQIRAEEVLLERFFSEYTLYTHGKRRGRVRINVPGLHYVRNTLAAAAVAEELDIKFETFKRAISKYRNVERRFHIKGRTKKGAIVVDDYAHHPTEIKETLHTIRHAWRESRVFVVFQPHRYTRTKYLMDEFASSFSDADKVIVTDIYPAGEEEIEGVSAKILVEKMGEKAIYISEQSHIPSYIEGLIEKEDVIVTMGAGDIWKVAQRLIR